jgi:hypothetical protein
MSARTQSIESVAEILPGFSPKRSVVHNSDGTYQIIMARHLEEGVPYRYQPGHAMRMTPERNAERYLVKPGDVLFISRGTRNIAAEIESVPDTTISTATFYQLKVAKERVLPAFLAWTINQPPFQAQLDEIRTGAGTPMIPRSAFAQIEVPVPDLSTQKIIVELARLQSRERALVSRLLEETVTKHRAAGTAILHELTRAGAKE